MWGTLCQSLLARFSATWLPAVLRRQWATEAWDHSCSNASPAARSYPDDDSSRQTLSFKQQTNFMKEESDEEKAPPLARITNGKDTMARQSCTYLYLWRVSEIRTSW